MGDKVHPQVTRYARRDARKREAAKSVRLAELQPIVDTAVAEYKAKIVELQKALAEKDAEIARLKAATGVPAEPPKTIQAEPQKGSTGPQKGNKGKQ